MPIAVQEKGGEPPVTARARTRAADRKPRIIGVDVARGLALIGMMATHVFAAFDDNGNPTVATLLAGGRSATTFVVVTGVSLAFLSGGRRGVRGPDRIAASAGLAVRAVIVGAIGLTLGYLGAANGINGILPLYGLLFLLAIPLLGSSQLMLLAIATALIAMGPILIVATADMGLPYSGYADDPTFTTLVQDPGGLLFQVGLTGAYPAVVYLAYLCVGLAIGRLDLHSRRVAGWLLGGGLALAVAARAASALVLYQLNGLDRLIEQNELANDPAGVTTLLWEPELSSSWWYLGLSAPHSHTPLDMLHTIGSAAAVIGAALLLTRVRLIARIVSPIAAAGSMSLTLYWAHLILLAFGVGEDQPPLLFLSMMVGALALAWVWRWRIGQGPLERLISETATSARRAVADHLKAAPVGPTLSGSPEGGLSTAERLAIRVLALVTCAGVLALALWGGAGSETAGLENPADAAEETLSEGFETVAPDGANITTPQAAPAQVPTLSPPAESAEVSAASAPGQAVADVQRYCELSRQLDAADEAEAPQLSELPQVAPSEIREAVTVIVDDMRAEADLPGATAPDEDTLEQAEATAEDFTARNC